MAALRIASKISRTRSRIVTISDPSAIDPRDRVDARPNAEMAGFFGFWGPPSVIRIVQEEGCALYHFTSVRTFRSKIIPTTIRSSGKSSQSNIPDDLRRPKEYKCFKKDQPCNFTGRAARSSIITSFQRFDQHFINLRVKYETYMGCLVSIWRT